MSECPCKCHESHPRLHCLRCAPSSDPVGEAFRAPIADALSPEQKERLAVRVMPDLTEMWARVFDEGVK